MATVASLDKSQLYNTIVFVESENMYSADNGLAKADFLPTGNKVIFHSKGFSVAWTPAAIKYVDEFGMDDTIYSVQDAPLEVKGNKARFDRSFPDVDDLFIVDGDRLKHTIIVQGWQREPLPWLSGKIDFVISGRLEFDSSLMVHSMGMNLVGPFETGESIEIRNGEETIFTLPKIVAFDSNIPERSETSGRYRVTANENGALAFDIVIDNAWMADPERVYPVLIDPTVVVSGTYDTSPNGARKIEALSNGWLVSSAYEPVVGTPVQFFVTKDGGATWAKLTTLKNAENQGYSIASVGTRIYVLYRYSLSTIKSSFFDALTVGSEIDASLGTVITSSETNASLPTSLTINPNGTELHGVWTAKTPAYPNLQNVRYAKGAVDSNGNVTWGSPVQVSTFNNSGEGDAKNPSIDLLGDGTPIITADVNTYYLFAWIFNGTSWDRRPVMEWTGYAQTNTTVLVKRKGANIGRIIVAWHGQQAGNGSIYNVRFTYSDNSGLSWASPINITTGSTVNRKDVVLSERDNGDIYAFYDDNGTITYQICNNGTAAFAGTTPVAPGTNPAVMAREAFAMIGFIWKDTTSVKFDSLVFNVPPNAPTNLSPNGTSVDRAIVNRLSWQYNDSPGDTQSKFDLQWRRVGASAWNTVTQTTPNQYWDAPANTFLHGNIEWRVRTYDQLDTVSPYSAQATFFAGDKPATPTIVSPANGSTVPVARPTLQWSSVDQVAYQAQVLSMEDAVLWDTGEVSSTNKAVTIGYDLSNNMQYKLRIRIKNADGLWSDWTTVTITVSYTPPFQPLVSIVQDNANARNRVIVTNPFHQLVNLLGTDGNCEDTSKFTYSSGTAALDSTRKTTGNNSIQITKTGTTSSVTPLSSRRIYPAVGDYYIAIADVYLENVASQNWLPNNTTGVTLTQKTVTGLTSGFAVTTTGAFVPIIRAMRVDAVTTPGVSYFTPFLIHVGTSGHKYNIDSFRIFKITQAEYDALPTSVDLATAQAIAAQYPYLDPSNPTVVSNEIFRREAGETSWQRIAQGVAPDSIYDDYTVASGVEYEYKVKANGNNGTYAESEVAAGKVTFSGVWLHCVDDPAGTIHRFALSSSNSDEWRADGSLMKFAGRNRPVAVFGEVDDGRITANLQMLRNRGDREALQNIISRKTPVCYRDNRGRKMIGVIFQLPSNDTFYGYSVQVSIDEIDYKEEV